MTKVHKRSLSVGLSIRPGPSTCVRTRFKSEATVLDLKMVTSSSLCWGIIPKAWRLSDKQIRAVMQLLYGSIVVKKESSRHLSVNTKHTSHYKCECFMPHN